MSRALPLCTAGLCWPAELAAPLGVKTLAATRTSIHELFQELRAVTACRERCHDVLGAAVAAQMAMEEVRFGNTARQAFAIQKPQNLMSFRRAGNCSGCRCIVPACKRSCRAWSEAAAAALAATMKRHHDSTRQLRPLHQPRPASSG